MARIDVDDELVNQRLFRSADYFWQMRERCEVSPPNIPMNQVKCNRERIPEDFVGQLAAAEVEFSRSQIATLNTARCDRRPSCR